MKTRVSFIICLLLVTNLAQAQGILFHGRVSNSVYAFEDIETHVRLYQRLRLNAEMPDLNLKFNTSMRIFTDLDSSFADDQRYNFYALSLEARQVLGAPVDLQLGRQFLHPGTILGALDGLKAQLNLGQKMALTLYGGVEAHFARAVKIYEADDALVGGGLFDYRGLFNNHLQLLYLQKNSSAETIWQITGLNLTNNSLPNTQIRTQLHYDLQNSRFHRLFLGATHQHGDKFSVALAFKSQFPQIYANSFFTIFEPDPYQHYTVSASCKIFASFYVNGFFQLLQTEDASANRMMLSLNNQNGNLGLMYESGDLGKQISLVADYGLEIMNNLMASLSVDYSRYKVEKIYEFENQLANAARLSYRFGKHWICDLEYQWLTNRLKDSDSRILNHIHFTW